MLGKHRGLDVHGCGVRASQVSSAWRRSSCQEAGEVGVVCRFEFEKGKSDDAAHDSLKLGRSFDKMGVNDQLSCASTIQVSASCRSFQASIYCLANRYNYGRLSWVAASSPGRCEASVSLVAKR